MIQKKPSWNKIGFVQVTVAILALLGVRLHATSVTLEINQFGFANSASTVTNGMIWGIVVDTSGSNGTNLSLMANGINPFTDTSNGFLSIGGAATPDFYFWNDAALVANQTTNAGPPPFSGGYIGTTGPLTTNVNGVAAGDPFGIIWFQTDGSAGSHYGFLTNPAFVLPADGSTTPFNADITGSAKAASLTVQPVPEPSTFVLALFAFAVLLNRSFRQAAAVGKKSKIKTL